MLLRPAQALTERSAAAAAAPRVAKKKKEKLFIVAGTRVGSGEQRDPKVIRCWQFFVA